MIQAKLGELAAENIKLKSKLQQIQIQDEQQVRTRNKEQEQVISAIMEELAELKRSSSRKETIPRPQSSGMRKPSLPLSPATSPSGNLTRKLFNSSGRSPVTSTPTKRIPTRSRTPSRLSSAPPHEHSLTHESDTAPSPLPAVPGSTAGSGSADRDRTTPTLTKQIQTLQAQLKVEQGTVTNTILNVIHFAIMCSMYLCD